MRFSPLVRDSLSLLAAHGLVGEVEQSAHFKVRFRNQFGCRCLLVIALRRVIGPPSNKITRNCGACCVDNQ